MFKRTVQKAGLDPMIIQGKGIRKFSRRSFHSLRHSFNSALANAGVTQEVRMKLTGHADARINKNYTHLRDETLKNAMEAMPLFS
jgi:integrase